MNNNDIDWKNFSCVAMMRSIRDEIDAKLDKMTPSERSEYFREINLKYSK